MGAGQTRGDGMSDNLIFHTVDELRGLPTEALTALWELVPTDRQKAYKAAYDGEVRAAGAAGSGYPSNGSWPANCCDAIWRRHSSRSVPAGQGHRPVCRPLPNKLMVLK